MRTNGLESGYSLLHGRSMEFVAVLLIAVAVAASGSAMAERALATPLAQVEAALG